MKTEVLENLEMACFSGINATIIAGGDGPFTIMEMSVEPNCGAPDHISFDEDKVFLIIEGTFDFCAGKERLRLSAGCRVNVARGDVHGFTNVENKNSRLVLVSSPARHDAFFRDMGALDLPHAPEKVMEICLKYNQQILMK